MSRCEHGQMISIFCLNESCTWREVGGCEACFKRYHSHPLTVGTISQEKLQELYRKMIIRPDPKVKSRVLQQAIYNYFVIVKNQLSSSIDVVSKIIVNKLNYPYLCEEGQLDIFNKIKNKQYKKIYKKQLKGFCQFVNKCSKQQFIQNQIDIYKKELKVITKQIQNINESFEMYEKVIKQLDSTFAIQKSYKNKITEIYNNIQQLIKQKPEDIKHEHDAKYPKNQPPTETVPKRHDRDRKISLDLTNISFKYRDNFNVDSEQKKKKASELIGHNNKNKIDQIKVEFQNQFTHDKNDKNKKCCQDLSEDNSQKNIQKNRAISVDKSFVLTNKQRTPQNIKQIDQGTMNDGEKIIHTILPRLSSKPKLYQNTKDVKQKKITIPVHIQGEQTQILSPLIKKKKNYTHSKPINLYKIQSTNEEEFISEKVQKKQSIFQEKHEDKLKLKDKQTQSLALLIQSLSLSAQKAIPLLQASIKYAHSNISAAQYLSYLYLQIGKPKQCLNLCNEFLEQIEDSPQKQELSEHLNNNKAAALNMLGRYSQSISILQRCIQNLEKDIYYKNLGDAYFSIGIFEKAVYNYECAIKLNTEMDQAYFNLAVCQYMQANFKESYQNIKRALQIKSDNQIYAEMNIKLKQKLNI